MGLPTRRGGRGAPLRMEAVEHAKHIASLAVVYVYADGRRVPGNIWVGAPEQVDNVEARCPVWLDGLDRDTLQALLLALRLLAARLATFEAEGGSVEYPDGEVVELDVYFGKLVAGEPSGSGS